MQKLSSIMWTITWRSVAVIGVILFVLAAMNQRQGWDARKAYETQDRSLTGRVGVAIVALTMPETYQPMFFENFVEKIFTQVIPWPVNVLAGGDDGIVLLDPTNPRATKDFQPQILVDSAGYIADIDGVSWAEKYRRGDIAFVKPSPTIAYDAGYFLYAKRKSGMRTQTAKTLLKARYVMYARLPNGYLPHFSQTKTLGEAALTQLRARHGITAGAVVEAFNPRQMEQGVRSILDTGIDTLILASVQPVYSDFEELHGSYSHVYAIVAAWQKQHPDKKIKIVIAPYMATAPSFDQLWAETLARVAPVAPHPGTSRARVILAMHGLPITQLNKDSWTSFARLTSGRMSPVLRSVMLAKGYRDVEVFTAAESFADKIEDPKNKIVSVAEEFARAKTDKIDIAIAVPIEFMAENTDTLFTHAAMMFDGQPGFTPYMGPPATVDWRKPYVRRFQNGTTTIIYTGAPGGDAAPQAGAVLADAISALWTR